MSLSERLGTALARLSGALDHLESAAEMRAEADAGRADVDLELALLQDDRSRLASDLDAALDRGRRLMAANGQVATRLDRASGDVEAVLAELERADLNEAAGRESVTQSWRASARAGE